MIVNSKSRLIVGTVLALVAATVFSCESKTAAESADAAKAEPAEVEAVQKAEPKAGASGARPASFAPVVKDARPAVVNIYTTKKLPGKRYIQVPGGGLIPGQRRAESLGSGFIVAPTGLVLTNWHVVEKATDIEVRLFDERRFPAKVLGFDPKTDVALLQMQSDEKLPHLEFASEETSQVGDWVVAIGNPLGLTSTVTAGIISATGRKSLPLGGEMMYQDFIQTDASINPGNSGGPLLNLEGKVVGINTAVHAEGQGLGFAIPIKMVAEIMPRLQKGGRVERSWLGVYIDPIPSKIRTELELPARGGVLVTRVVRGGPAANAGLKPGDIVLKMDGKSVPGPDELAWMAGNVGVGKQIVLNVQRGGTLADITVTLGALPQ